MRVMVFMIAAEDGQPSEPPTPEAFAAMDRFNDELVEAGVLVAGAGLKPADEAKRIDFDATRATVTDGPFAEVREMVAGFSIWQVNDMDEAVAWARRCPNHMPGRVKIELRAFLEADDLADYLTPEDISNPRQGDRGKLGVA